MTTADLSFLLFVGIAALVIACVVELVDEWRRRRRDEVVTLTDAEREDLMDACPVQITPSIEDHARLFEVVERILASRRPS